MHKIASCLRSSVVLSVVSVVVGVASVGPSQVGAIEYSCYDQPYECYSCVNIPLFGSRCMAVLPEVTGRCNCSQEQIFPAGTYCTLGGAVLRANHHRGIGQQGWVRRCLPSTAASRPDFDSGTSRADRGGLTWAGSWLQHAAR